MCSTPVMEMNFLAQQSEFYSFCRRRRGVAGADNKSITDGFSSINEILLSPTWDFALGWHDESWRLAVAWAH